MIHGMLQVIVIMCLVRAPNYLKKIIMKILMIVTMNRISFSFATVIPAEATKTEMKTAAAVKTPGTTIMAEISQIIMIYVTMQTARMIAAAPAIVKTIVVYIPVI